MKAASFRFSLTQLFLITTLCALAMGLMVTVRRQSRSRAIISLSLSPDDGLLLATYVPQEVRIWDIRGARPRAVEFTPADAEQVYLGRAAFVDHATVAFLVPGDAQAEIVLWDVSTNRRKRSISLPYRAEAPVISGLGGYAAVQVAGTTSIDLWDLDQGERMAQLSLPDSPDESMLVDLAASADGSVLAARVVIYGQDNGRLTAEFAVVVWDVSRTLENERPGPERELEVIPGRLPGIALEDPFELGLSPDGRWLISSDGHRWDVESGEKSQLATTDGLLQAPVFSHDGSLVAICRMSDVEIRDAASGRLRATLETPGQLSWLDSLGFPRAAFAGDGSTIVTSYGETIGIWDAGNYRLLRTIDGDRRLASYLIFAPALIAWCVVWGLVARWRRAPDALPASRSFSPPPPDKLPAALSAALHPLKTLLTLTFWFAVLMAVIFGWRGVDVMWTWGPRDWGHFVLKVTAGTAALFVAAFLLAWCLPALRRRIYGAVELRRKKAVRATGRPARQVQHGPLTAFFLGHSLLEADVAVAFDEARRRYEQLVGEPLAEYPPVLLFCFQKAEDRDRFCDGRLPLTAMYWTTPGHRELVLCEDDSLDAMTEPRRLLHTVLAHYFFHAHRGFFAPAWLGAMLGWLLACDDEAAALDRVDRFLRACEPPPQDQPLGSLAMPPREFLRAALLRDQLPHAKRLAEMTNRAASLAAFLAGETAGPRRGQFAQLVREIKPKETVEPALDRHFGGCRELVHQWQSWREARPRDLYAPPPPLLAQHLHQRLVPLLRDPQTPAADKVQAVRGLSCGYVQGGEVLIELLESGDAALRDDVIWALETTSGQRLGGDVQRWRDWWDSLPESARSGRPAADDDVVLAELADVDTAQPLVAEIVDQQPDVPAPPSASAPAAASAPHDEQRAAAAARQLKVIWAILGLCGVLGILWSLAIALLPDLALVGYFGIVAGMVPLIKSVARDTRRLEWAALLAVLGIVTCNLVNLALGSFAWVLIRRTV